MAGVPLKFRCYQCNQLLGVSRTKIGSEVSCPKCGTGLLVPDPAESSATIEVPPSGSRSATGTQGIMDVGLPLDLIDIRPEDIRVEPGLRVDRPLSREERFPFVEGRESGSGEHAMPVGPNLSDPEIPQALAAPTPTPELPTLAVPPSPPEPEPEPVVAPIRLEPQRIGTDRGPAVRSRDVVLPRSVVAAWSLFMLLAQALTFLAGLLAGHFLWRVH